MKYTLWAIFCLLLRGGAVAQPENATPWIRASAGASTILDKTAAGQFHAIPSCGLGFNVKQKTRWLAFSFCAGYKQMGTYDRRSEQTLSLRYFSLEGLIGPNPGLASEFILIGAYLGLLKKNVFSTSARTGYYFNGKDLGCIVRAGRKISIVKKLNTTLDLSGYLSVFSIYKNNAFPLTTRGSAWTGNADLSLGLGIELK